MDNAIDPSYDLTPWIPREVSNTQGTEDDDHSSIGTMSVGEKTFKKADKALKAMKKSCYKAKRRLKTTPNWPKIRLTLRFLILILKQPPKGLRCKKKDTFLLVMPRQEGHHGIELTMSR